LASPAFAISAYSISPSIGPLSGTAIILFGNNLQYAEKIYIGTNECPIVDKVPAQVICTAPAVSTPGKFSITILHSLTHVQSSVGLDFNYVQTIVEEGALLQNAGTGSMGYGDTFDTAQVNCVDHPNGDLTAFFNQGITGLPGPSGLPVEPSAIATAAFFSRTTHTWNTLSSSGWTTGDHEMFDITGSQFVMANLGFDFNPVTGSYLGVGSPLAHSHKEFFDDHGVYHAMRWTPNSGTVNYYQPDNSYQKNTDSTFDLSTWNAAIVRPHVGNAMKFHPTLPIGLAVLNHVCCSATPTSFNFSAHLVDQATQQWSWWNNTLGSTGGWSSSKPGAATNPPELRLLPVGTSYNLYPTILPIAQGFIIVFATSNGVFDYTNIHIRAVRYLHATQTFEIWGGTSSGFVPISQPGADLDQHAVFARGDSLNWYSAATDSLGNLYVGYFGTDNITRVITLNGAGTSRTETVISVPLNIVSSIKSPSLALFTVRDSGRPALLASDLDSGKIYGSRLTATAWAAWTSSDPLVFSDSQKKPRVFCVQAMTLNDVLVIAQNTYGSSSGVLTSLQSLGSVTVTNPVVISRSTTVTTPPSSKLQSPDNSFPALGFPTYYPGDFDVSNGTSVFAGTSTTNLLSIHWNIFQAPTIYNDWNTFRFTTSVVRDPTAPILYVLEQGSDENSELHTFDTQGNQLTSIDTQTGLAGIPLRYARHMAFSAGRSSLFVADGRNSRVVEATFSSGILMATNTVNLAGKQLSGICVNTTHVFVASLEDQQVFRIPLGSQTPDLAIGNVTPTSSKLLYPESLTCNDTYLVVNDVGHRMIRVYSTSGQLQYSFNSVNISTSPAQTQLQAVQSVLIDRSSNALYVWTSSPMSATLATLHRYLNM
jgi:hypothetical protein